VPPLPRHLDDVHRRRRRASVGMLFAIALPALATNAGGQREGRMMWPYLSSKRCDCKKGIEPSAAQAERRWSALDRECLEPLRVGLHARGTGCTHAAPAAEGLEAP
jgi:hypothetical protein